MCKIYATILFNYYFCYSLQFIHLFNIIFSCFNQSFVKIIININYFGMIYFISTKCNYYFVYRPSK